MNRDQVYVVAGVPSNDFGNQGPGKEMSMKNFFRLTCGVDYPIYGKTRVICEGAYSLYPSLNNAAGQSPHWNFHEYLLGG